MDLTEQSLAVNCYAMAILAKAAYKKDARSEMIQWGFLKDYRYLNNDSSEGHIACNDTHIAITLRGTEFTKLDDLLIDAELWPKSHGTGWVHTGFRKAARNLLPEIKNYVYSHPDREVYITGHSMGGAMGLYIAQELQWSTSADVTLFSYGSPCLGNKEYVQHTIVPHHRFVNCNDMVPHLPWKFLGYRQHGTMHYISRDGKVCKPSSWRRLKDYILSKLDAWRNLKPIDGFADHNMLRYIEKLGKVTKI